MLYNDPKIPLRRSKMPTRTVPTLLLAAARAERPLEPPGRISPPPHQVHRPTFLSRLRRPEKLVCDFAYFCVRLFDVVAGGVGQQPARDVLPTPVRRVAAPRRFRELKRELVR